MHFLENLSLAMAINRHFPTDWRCPCPVSLKAISQSFLSSPHFTVSYSKALTFTEWIFISFWLTTEEFTFVQGNWLKLDGNLWRVSENYWRTLLTKSISWCCRIEKFCLAITAHHPLIFKRPRSSMMKQFSAPNFNQKTLQDTHWEWVFENEENAIITILFEPKGFLPRIERSASAPCQMDFLIYNAQGCLVGKLGRNL